MVAGRHRFDDAGDAGRVQPRQQHRRFDLGRCDGQPVFDRDRRAQAAHRQRQAIARTGGEVGAHARQRFDHPPHRTPRQRRIADERRGDRMAGDQAHQQPGRRARIAHVERGLRLQQPADADAPHMPDAIAVALDRRAHRPHRCGGGQHVLALQQPFDPALPDGQPREHQRPVADRLVPGHGQRAAQRAAGGNHLGLGSRVVHPRRL